MDLLTCKQTFFLYSQSKDAFWPSRRVIFYSRLRGCSCPIAISFWSDFIVWYQSFPPTNLSLSNNEILYGVLSGSSSCPTLNHLILVGKYFLYCKALNNVKFQFADFTNLVYMYGKIETERYIAIMHGTFLAKWPNFIN